MMCMYNIEQSAKHAELNDRYNATTSMTMYQSVRLEYYTPISSIYYRKAPRDYNSIEWSLYVAYNPLEHILSSIRLNRRSL